METEPTANPEIERALAEFRRRKETDRALTEFGAKQETEMAELARTVISRHPDLSQCEALAARLAYPIADPEDLQQKLRAHVGDTLWIGDYALPVAGMFDGVPEAISRLDFLYVFPIPSYTDLATRLAIVALALRVVEAPEALVASAGGAPGQSEDDRDATASMSRDGGDAEAPLELTAYEMVNGASGMTLENAPRSRSWLRTGHSNGQLCLPLMMANEAGWFVISGHTFEAVWNGGPCTDDVQITHLGGFQPLPVEAQFGSGIITWSLPYLFRTPPGTNLLARGPANWPRDGVAYLEGLVETDWSPATFTVSWQITRPDHAIRVDAGEPIAMLVPQPRDYLQRFTPALRAISDAPQQLYDEHATWSVSRQLYATIKDYVRRPQGHYFRGVTPSGSQAPEHTRKLGLGPFERRGNSG